MGDKAASEEEARSAVLLDDRDGWLENAERVLAELSVDVVSKERNPRSALLRIEQERPDLLLVNVDARTPDQSRPWFECLDLARERVPTLKGIVFGDAERSKLDAAFAAGAVAYLDTTAGPDEIASAIRQAFGRSLHF